MEVQYILFIAVGVLVLLAVGCILLYNRLQRLRIKVEEGGADIDVALQKRYDLLSEQIETVKKYLAHEYKVFTDVTALRTKADQEEKLRLQQKGLSEEALRTIDAQIAAHTQSMEQIRGSLDRSALHHQPRRRHRKDEDRAEQITAQQQALSQHTAQRDVSVSQKIDALAAAHRDLATVGAGFDALAEQYPILNSWIPMDRFQRSISDSEEHLQAARRLYNANVSRYNQTLRSIPWSIVAALTGMREAGFYEIEDHKRSLTVKFN